MIETVVKVIAGLAVAIAILVLFYFLRKTERKNHLVTVEESQLHWTAVKCNACGRAMEQGYAFAGKGIRWTPREQRKPGTFATVMSSLENTFSMRIPPPLNMAWYCSECKLILIDHSKMIRFKKTLDMVM